MKCKTMILWWFANEAEHPQLEKDDKRIEALMPLVSALFPGINYYSMSGFSSLMHACVIPAIKSQFPELLTTPANAITADMMTEVSEVLPVAGHEWTDPAWPLKLNETLARGKQVEKVSAGTEQEDQGTTSQSYACSLAAMRGEVAHTAMLLGFKKPLTKKEAEAEALQACMQQYPASEGWAHHGISVAAFDAQRLAEQLASA